MHMEQFDLVSVGDAILDIFLSIHDQSEFCKWDDKGHLMIHAGSKILIDESAFMLGGNACNVAAGIKRLGFDSGLIAELGDDEFAAKLKNGLTKEGVSQDFVKTTSGAPSTFSVGIQVGNDRTLFVHHVEREHVFDLSALHTKWLYLTSLGNKWEHVYQQVIEYKKTHDMKLAFNPGSAQMHAGVESFKDVLPVTDVLCINRDEAEIILYNKILDEKERDTEENMLFRIQRLGVKMIVMTDGGNGAYVMDESAKLYYEKAVSGEMVGKTGAGDAYSSGFLGGLLSEKNVQEAMQWGAANAAAVIGHIGAQTGLLTQEGMQQFLSSHPMQVEAVKEKTI